MTNEMDTHKVGDHRLVTIPTALTEVTFDTRTSNTSDNDTETTKYFDEFESGGIQVNLVADQAIQVLGLNGTDFTDAIPVLANKIYGEDKINVTRVKIKTTVDNTTISVRMR